MLGLQRVVAVEADEGTSLVPMRNISSAGIEYASSRPSGKNPVPVIARSRTITGGKTSFIPRSMSVSTARRRTAISSSAPSPTRAYDRPPANFRGPSQFTYPSPVISSTWSFAVKSKVRGVPTRRTSTLSSSPLPMGTSGRGMLGTRSIRSWNRRCTSARRGSSASMSVRTCLASSTSFGRSSLVALGICAESSFLRARFCSSVVVASRRSLSAESSSSRSSERRLFAMAARTTSAFCRMNWISSIGPAF